MPEPVKTRTYASSVRDHNAASTRVSILAAARSLFELQGYRGTTVKQIAERAEVNVDTIYHTIGRKPALMRELVETSLSGRDEAVPAQQRGYVEQIRSVASAGEKIDIYCQALVHIQERLAPIFLALRDAAATDDACRDLWKEISERRSHNMLEFAADLRMTGEVREDLDDRMVADIIWSMNAAEYWAQLVGERGWTPTMFADWLCDAWRRLLLDR